MLEDKIVWNFTFTKPSVNYNTPLSVIVTLNSRTHILCPYAVMFSVRIASAGEYRKLTREYPHVGIKNSPTIQI